MAKKKKQPKVEKVFKGKDEKQEDVLVEEKVESEHSGSDVDDILGVEDSPKDELTEKQRAKLEKINNVKNKISKILQSTNVEIIDENFDDEYESSDSSGSVSQEDLDSLKSMYGNADKNKKAGLTLTIDDFDYMYVGQYLEEYDLMHMKNIKRVKIQRKKSPRLKKFLIISSLVVVIAVGSVLAFFLTRKTPVYLKSISLTEMTKPYYIGDEFDFTGLYLLAEYSDGEVKKIKLENSHFNNELSTGKFERSGENNSNILFVNNGNANLVFSYQGLNASYDFTVKKKTELGLQAIYSDGLYNLPASGLISKDLLKVFINYQDLGMEYIEYSQSTPISVYVNGQKCSQAPDGYLVPTETSGKEIKIVYGSFQLRLEPSLNLVKTEQV